MPLYMFIIDYNDKELTRTGHEHVCAPSAQAAVNDFLSYMPNADELIIDGVYKEVHNWKQRRR